MLRRSALPKVSDEPAENLPALIFAGWRQDLSRRQLRTLDNMMVPLSGAEFDLLLAFAEHPQRVLIRDQLLDYGARARARRVRSQHRRSGQPVAAED